MIPEQEALYFYFALEPTNHVIGPAHKCLISGVCPVKKVILWLHPKAKQWPQKNFSTVAHHLGLSLPWLESLKCRPRALRDIVLGSHAHSKPCPKPQIPDPNSPKLMWGGGLTSPPTPLSSLASHQLLCIISLLLRLCSWEKTNSTKFKH